MSDDTHTSADGNNGGPLAGELLAQARRSRDISLNEIAKELHLDESRLQALERNDFDFLGAPVFAKGYLRKYAGLVGVSPDDVIAGYYRLNRSASAPPLVTTRPRPARDFSTAPWLLGLALVLVLALAALWWFTAGTDRLAADGAATPVSLPAAEDAAELPERVPADATGANDPAAGETEGDPPPSGQSQPERESATQAAAEPAATESTPPSSAATQPGELQLRLAFSGDCWTEVTDASGRRLYFGLGSAGNAVTVSGEAPLNVLLGDSANVSVFVNGASYVIPASARRGETARLTLTAR